jgi:hypothetical protein
MNSEQISAYSIAISSFVASAILLSKEISRRKREIWQTKAADVNLEAARIYDELHSLTSAIHADRALVLYTSNGGGIPSAGKTIYTTILYEVVHGDGLQPIRKEFQNVLIDEAYTYMLRDVIEERIWICNDVAKMRNGFLKRLYQREKVKSAIIVPIYSTPERFYYLSVRWMNDNEFPNTDTRRSIVEGCATSIKEILEK